MKEGNLATGELVKVVWGKSKKMYEAVVLSTDQRRSPVIPIQAPRPRQEFTMEKGSPPATPQLEVPSNQNRKKRKTLIQKRSY